MKLHHLKGYLIVLFVLLTGSGAKGQTLKFFSAEFEEALRQQAEAHGVTDITAKYCDTLTVLHLADAGITDIRDIIYFPMLREADLSSNRITNIAPLCTLDSLRSLSLSDNELTTIDPLVFAVSDSMTVNVAWNYITDMRIFGGYVHCAFTFEGLTTQQERVENNISLHRLISSTDCIVGDQITYNAESNAHTPLTLSIGKYNFPLEADGDDHTIDLSTTGITQTVPAVITSDRVRLETYYVPSLTFAFEAGQETVIDLKLPDTYTIVSPNVTYGTVEADDDRLLHYQPAAGIVSDELTLYYKEMGTYKGFCRLQLREATFGDVNVDGMLDNRDVIALVDFLTEQPALNFYSPAADINHDGRLSLSDITALIKYIRGKASAGHKE